MVLADDAYRGLVYSNDPVLLLLGDHEAGLAEARAAAARAGCRIAGEAGIIGGLARFDAQIGAKAALVAARAPSPDLTALLERVNASARAGGIKGIVVVPPAMIDFIATDLPTEIEHLIDPTPDELDLAISVVTEAVPASLHDVSNRNDMAILQQLSEEAARIASVLAAMSEQDGPAAGEADEGRDAPEVDSGYVRSIIRARRLRDQFFRGELFADPAFDILLDLYAARLDDTRVAVSSLCIAAAVPATTALRWIKHLTDQGLLVRAADPQDGRRVYIGLSDDAARAMGRYLVAVQRSGLPAV